MQPSLKTFSLEEPDYPLVQTVTKSWRPLSPSDEAKIVELYREGRTTTQLAAQFGVHRTTVSRAVERAGVPLRGVRPTKEQIAEMRRLRDAGETYAEIAREIGFSMQTVRTYVRRRCVELDPTDQTVVSRSKVSFIRAGADEGTDKHGLAISV